MKALIVTALMVKTALIVTLAIWIADLVLDAILGRSIVLDIVVVVVLMITLGFMWKKPNDNGNRKNKLGRIRERSEG